MSHLNAPITPLFASDMCPAPCKSALQTAIGEFGCCINMFNDIVNQVLLPHTSGRVMTACDLATPGKCTSVLRLGRIASRRPRHCKEAIPYSQALWMRCICSSDVEAFNKRITDLKKHLTCRGYDETTVQQQIERAKHHHQEDALRPPAEKATNKRTPHVVSYQPNLPNLTALTKEKLPILHASNCLK